MLRSFLKLIGLLRHDETVSLDRRRVITAAVLLALLPLVLVLWGMSLQHSFSGQRNFGQVIHGPMEQGRDALIVIEKGFANLQIMFGTLLRGAQNYGAE